MASQLVLTGWHHRIPTICNPSWWSDGGKPVRSKEELHFNMEKNALDVGKFGNGWKDPLRAEEHFYVLSDRSVIVPKFRSR
jgi:hypothetical protein